MDIFLFILAMVCSTSIFIYILGNIWRIQKKIDELEAKSIYYEKAYEQMRDQRNKFIKQICELQIKKQEVEDPNTNL